MDEPDYKALRAISPKRIRGESAERQAEKKRRVSIAQGRARTAMVNLYPEEYASLLRQATEEVQQELGALPE